MLQPKTTKIIIKILMIKKVIYCEDNELALLLSQSWNSVSSTTSSTPAQQKHNHQKSTENNLERKFCSLWKIFSFSTCSISAQPTKDFSYRKWGCVSKAPWYPWDAGCSAAGGWRGWGGGSVRLSSTWILPVMKHRTNYDKCIFGSGVISIQANKELFFKAFLTTPGYSQPIDTLKDVLDSGLSWGMVSNPEKIVEN